MPAPNIIDFVTITNRASSRPFLIGGNLYIVLSDGTKAVVRKSIDSGVTWTPEDDAGSVALLGTTFTPASCTDGTKIYVTFTTTILLVEWMSIAVFDTTTDTWTSATVCNQTETDADGSVNIEFRPSDGNCIILSTDCGFNFLPGRRCGYFTFDTATLLFTPYSKCGSIVASLFNWHSQATFRAIASTWFVFITEEIANPSPSTRQLYLQELTDGGALGALVLLDTITDADTGASYEVIAYSDAVRAVIGWAISPTVAPNTVKIFTAPIATMVFSSQLVTDPNVAFGNFNIVSDPSGVILLGIALGSLTYAVDSGFGFWNFLDLLIAPFGPLLQSTFIPPNFIAIAGASGGPPSVFWMFVPSFVLPIAYLPQPGSVIIPNPLQSRCERTSQQLCDDLRASKYQGKVVTYAVYQPKQS